jgi:plastocyanin
MSISVPRILLAAACLAGSVAGLDPAVSRAGDAAPPVVHIANFAFAPATLTVPVGTTVTWVNGDDAPHVVAEQHRMFRSRALETQDRFTHTFAEPGSFTYLCTLHPHMVGTIVVEPRKQPS